MKKSFYTLAIAFFASLPSFCQIKFHTTPAEEQKTPEMLALTKVNLDDKASVVDIFKSKAYLNQYDFSGLRFILLNDVKSKLTIHPDGTIDKANMAAQKYYTVDRYWLTKEQVEDVEDSLCKKYSIYTKKSITKQQYVESRLGDALNWEYKVPRSLFGDRFFDQKMAARYLKQGASNSMVPVLARIIDDDGTQYYVENAHSCECVFEDYVNKYILPLVGQKIRFTCPYIKDVRVPWNEEYGSLCLGSYAMSEPSELVKIYNGYRDSDYDYTIEDITIDPQNGDYIATFTDKNGNKLEDSFSINKKICYIDGSGECNDIASGMFLTATQRDNFLKYIEPYKKKADAALEAQKAAWAKADKESKEQFRKNRAQRIAAFAKKYGAHYANLLAANKFEMGMSKQMLLEWYTTMDMKLQYRGDTKEVWIRTVTLNDLRKFELTFIRGKLVEYHVVMP